MEYIMLVNGIPGGISGCRYDFIDKIFFYKIILSLIQHFKIYNFNRIKNDGPICRVDARNDTFKKSCLKLKFYF